VSAALAVDDQANTEKKKKGKNRKIKSILAWTECFLTYMGVVLAKQPERLLDLLGSQRYFREYICELLGSIILSACLVWGL